MKLIALNMSVNITDSLKFVYLFVKFRLHIIIFT